MKKIYLVSIYDCDQSGGLSTYVKNLNKVYRDNGFDSNIFTPFSTQGFQKYVNKFLVLSAKGIYVINKNIGLKVYYTILGNILNYQIKNNIAEVEMIHFQDGVSLYFFQKGFGKSWSGKKILTLHGDLTNMNLSDKIICQDSTGYRYSYMVEKKGYEYADKIIAVDERLKKHAYGFGVSKDKIENFPNFTDISKFYSVTDEEKKTLRMNYNIPADKKVIFCPRRLVDKNGVIYAIETMSLLPDDFILIITGEGQEREKVLARIQELSLESRVILTGDIPNTLIRNYYCLSDMTIVPSINSNGVIEATSISSIESMACGVPVIASRIGGLCELIKDGYNGYLCEEKNIQEFSQKIISYFELNPSEKEQIIDNSIKSVIENFSAKSYFDKIKKFIF